MGKISVVMFGPNLKTTSGISNVINNWLECKIEEKVDLLYISTLNNYSPGRYIEKLLNAAVCYLHFIFLSKKNLDFCATMGHICSQWHGLYLSPIRKTRPSKNSSKFSGWVLIKQLHAVALARCFRPLLTDSLSAVPHRAHPACDESRLVQQLCLQN